MAGIGDPNIKPGPGRPQGSKDKIARSVKDRIIAVWDSLEAGGQSLEEVAKADPPWFYANFVKGMIPKEVEAKVQGEMGVRFTTNALTKCLTTTSDTTADP